MSSQPRTDSQGSKSRPRLPVPAIQEDVIDISLGDAPPTDDTPTIISRQSPAANATPGTTGAETEANTTTTTTSIRGRRLAHFELIEPIGVGGMAAVLRARDTQLDRLVALKILPPEMAGDEENVRRFHQEARSAARLDHENIARVFYCGEDQRLHFIAFEFVEGENLRTLLERRGRIPVGEALHYMLQVAAGLAHAARRGVVHRDIKPSNIIVTPNGRAKLVDMGLARCEEAHNDHDLTQSGVTLGTFDYISPEQALEPREADVRSDIYSLGCTFYHMLTGRPPVPEGTAAKKLHCHQHVKPPDPRQFVPDLPTEVVLILDRMMAKQPRDRFQAPEELVHQLVVAARRLGASPEVPEGVLIVEGAVPNQPVSRPLLWAALGAVAVVGLVFLLDQVPSGSPSTHGRPAVVEQGDRSPKDKQGDPVVKPIEQRAPERRTETRTGVAVYTSPSEPTAQHLIRWLQEHRDANRIELRLAGDLDLSPLRGGAAGLLVAAKQEVIIRAHDARQRPTLRLHYNGDETPKDKPLVALTINSKRCMIEDVRFIVDVRKTDVSMAALLLQDGHAGSQHTIRGCEFIQAQASFGQHENGKGLASLVCEGRLSSRVIVRDCAFLGFGKVTHTDGEQFVNARLSEADLGGQDAIVRRGPVRIEASGCLFGPHSAAFRLEGDGRGDEGLLTVRHCSVLLAPRRSAVFEFSERGTGKLDVGHSLFSRLSGDDADGAVLLRQTGGELTDVVYHGRDNCYHDLDGYWVRGNDSWQKAGWGDFKSKLGETRGQDESRLVGFAPWESPPAEQVKALEEAKPNLRKTFRIRLNLAALRLQGRSRTEVVGSETILGQRWLPATLPLLDDKIEAGVRRFLVVDQESDDSSNGLYPSLVQAVSSARAGDTILIRKNGEMGMDPVQLNKKGLSDLTIRPARRFKPVLVLGETTDADTALFRVHEGRLLLEGLEFRLMPSRRLTMQTLVALVGDGECTLRQCVATLQRSGETRLALATLAAAGKVMALDMPAARTGDQGPKLTLDGCFIRGEGDLLWTKASRPFGLEMKKSLAALSGSLVNIEIGPDAAAPPETQRTQVSLRNVTTWLGGSLLRFSTGKDPRGLVPVTCKASGCLFVPAGPGKTMISLEGSDTEEKALRDKFTWEGGPNTYGTFGALQKQTPAGEEMATPPVTVAQWKALSGEEGSLFAVELVKAPSVETRFWQIEPGHLTPPKEAIDSGATLSLLPQPAKRGAVAEKER
jgi:serine/threonine protein kinase